MPFDRIPHTWIFHLLEWQMSRYIFHLRHSLVFNSIICILIPWYTFMYSMFCNVSLDTFLGVFDISALICKGCKESKIISPALELGSEIYTLELQKNFNQKLLEMSILSKLFLLLVCVLKSIPSLILKSNLSLIPKIWHIWFQLNSWYEDRIQC